MNIFIDYHSRTPVYEQIKEQVVRDINRGILLPDERLPSLRQLSAELGLNINTIKRALTELEAMGITYSVAGKGIFISPDAVKNKGFARQAEQSVKKAALSAAELGVPKERLLEIIDEIYKGVEKE